MSPLVLPYFETGQALWASQVNLLTEGLMSVQRRGTAIRLPTPQVSGVTMDPITVYEGRYIHFHDADVTEHLYYDIETIRGSEEYTTQDVHVRIYWHGSLIKTLTQANGRKRELLSLANFPTAGSHPGDATEVIVRVEAEGTADDKASCSVVVYALKEISLPGAGYTTMNDALALTNNEQASVATDLQHIVDNLKVLDKVACGDIPFFRCVMSPYVDLGNGPVTIGIWHWETNNQGTLYYKVRLFKDVSTTGTVTLKFYLNTSTLVKTITYSGFWSGGTTPYTEEGEINISAYSWNTNQRIRIHATVEYSRNDGAGAAEIVYLGESDPGDDTGLVPVPVFASPDYVEGTASLRTLWDNMLVLADDSGSGYRSHQDMSGDGNYPCGYAVACRKTTILPKGAWIGGGSVLDEEGNWVFRYATRYVLDLLYTKSKGASLVYVGSSGEIQRRGLEDYDDDNPYRVFDLRSIRDLIPGMWYMIEVNPAEVITSADMDNGIEEDETAHVLYAYQRES